MAEPDTPDVPAETEVRPAEVLAEVETLVDPERVPALTWTPDVLPEVETVAPVEPCRVETVALVDPPPVDTLTLVEPPPVETVPRVEPPLVETVV